MLLSRARGADHRNSQGPAELAVRRAAIASAYEKVLGPLSDADRDNIIILTETKQAALFAEGRDHALDRALSQLQPQQACL